MCRVGLMAALLLIGSVRLDAGQLGALISPGPLARAHAALEGGSKCQQCHEAGRKVTPARCLTCHKPIADRMAARKGVHRSAGDCVTCHVEHAGIDAELRHLDTKTFNHTTETGFPLEGVHARNAANCAACHKTRSFLEARPACSSCHADPHKGSLGADCASCHSTKVGFKQARQSFDHAAARFPLTAAHRQVACEKCHKAAGFRDPPLMRTIEATGCAACHVDPHRKKLGAVCTSCHAADTWNTRTVNHAKTRFPLAGAHAQVACAKCHQAEAMTRPVRFDQCSACHVNVHRESVKEDCRACHTETTFRGAPFDHGVRTGFPLDGKHAGIACITCHTTVSGAEVPLAKKVVNYAGASTSCAACHKEKDPHRGTFGAQCEACHRTATFEVKAFAHPRAPDFYGGQHAAVKCEQCHVRAGPGGPTSAAMPPMTCVSCHADTHLGQLGAACERCHSVDGVKFRALAFSHDRSPFPLTGGHQAAECAKCHHTETRAFPSRAGSAVVYHGVGTDCQTCHKDPHLGQVATQCETCHQTASFKIDGFAHTGLDDFFKGFHGKYACKDCHKTETGRFPTGPGTAVRFRVGRDCAACHPKF